MHRQAHRANGVDTVGPPPPITEVEQHGIAIIPDEDRTASPLDVFRIIVGGANSIPVAVLGTLPILVFGLGFWQAVAATLIGLTVGSLILMPMALFGPVTGTNNAVASGAHFGVLGRLVGSFLAMLTAVTFFALSVYTSGDVLVGALDELVGTGQPDWLFAIAYGFFAVAVLVVCLYGFRFMLAVNRIAVPASIALFLLSGFAFAGEFDASYEGTLAASGASATAAFIASALLIAANPISFGAFLGDWTRYVPRETPRRRLMAATFAAQLTSAMCFLFGIATSVVVVRAAPEFASEGNWIGGLLATTPGWFLAPLCIITIVGGLAAGTSALYGPGLDLSSIFPRLTRFRATAIVGTAAIAIVFAGRFLFSFVDTIVTFATLIVVCATPWVVVMTIGYLQRRGWYSPVDLQVFNQGRREQVFTQGRRDGIYCYTRGINWRAMTTWLVATIAGLLFVNVPGQFEGPLRNTASDLGLSALAGVDISLAVVIALSSALYLALTALFPEPGAVFGPTREPRAEAGPAPLPASAPERVGS